MGVSEDISGGFGDLGTVGRVVGSFKSSGGRYRLDVNVLSDTGFLNDRHPRLKVQADGDAYNRRDRLYVGLPFASALLTAIGGALFLVSRAEPNAR